MAKFNSKEILLMGLKGEKGEKGDPGEKGSGTTITVDGVVQETWEANSKVDKITTTGYYMLYAIQPNGTPDNRKIVVNDGNLGSGTIPSYQSNNTSNYGKNNYNFVLATGTPKNPYHATPMQYVDDGLSGKLDRVDGTTLSGRMSAYVETPNGSRTSLAIEDKTSTRVQNIVTYRYKTETADTTPAGGGVLITDTPTKEFHSANKKYVDEQKKHLHVFGIENDNGSIIGSGNLHIYSTKATPFESLDEIPSLTAIFSESYDTLNIVMISDDRTRAKVFSIYNNNANSYEYTNLSEYYLSWDEVVD